MLSPLAKKILTIQRQQFTMALQWIAMIEDENTIPVCRAEAVKQLGITINGIVSVAADIAEIKNPLS